MLKFKLFFAAFSLLFLFAGCANSPDKVDQTNNDSIQIIELLQNVYKWHNSNLDQIDFDIIVKDSLQVGLDTLQLKNSIIRLKETSFFNSDFLKNYDRIGRAVDSKLRNGKYYNEINFSFQDSDPWNYFQDDEKDYWNRLNIVDFAIRADSASFNWYLNSRDNKYLVKVKRENGIWKISYLGGFDYEEVLK